MQHNPLTRTFMTENTTWVLVAKILKAHGIKGSVHIRCFTQKPEKLAEYAPLKTRDHKVFDIKPLHLKGEILVAHLSNVTNRTHAENLKGIFLYADRASFASAAPEEFYISDLEGLYVKVLGAIVGRIRAVQNYGAGDILIIHFDSGAEVLLPFTKASVPDIDVGAGHIVVDPESMRVFSEGKR